VREPSEVVRRSSIATSGEEEDCGERKYGWWKEGGTATGLRGRGRESESSLVRRASLSAARLGTRLQRPNTVGRGRGNRSGGGGPEAWNWHTHALDARASRYGRGPGWA